jgi:hypothetical protein
MNVHDLLTLLVLVLTPLATMAAVRIQLRGQADRDLYHFHRQRLEARDATLRAAYVKVLRAAELLIDGVQDLKLFPTGRPHIERSEVTSGAMAMPQPNYMSIYRENGDYSRVTQLLDEAQQLKTEATIDIGVEHDEDACLEFFDEHFDRPFWGVYDVMVGGSGYTPDLDATLTKMRGDQKQLAALARQSREAILAAPPTASWWKRLRAR